MKQETESIISELEIENANLRSRCEKLKKERNGLSLLRDHLEEEIGKFRTRCERLEKERDDARRKLEAQYEISQQEYKENSQLRGQLNKMKTTWLEALDLWKRLRITLERERDRSETECDEAREWARRLYQKNDRLQRALAFEQDSLSYETSRIKEYRTQARNDVLDEARAECTKIFAETIHIEAHKMLVRVIEILRTLKTTTKE